MKVTIYTVSDCKFSQAEKEYLKSINTAFEEKNLESNREYLTEMLNLSNNFAGTPVTKIEKDDGQITVLKGFTKEEFDTALGFSGEIGTNQNTTAQPGAQQPTSSALPTTPADEVSLPPLPAQDPVPVANATMPPASSQSDMMPPSSVQPPTMPTDQPTDTTNPLISTNTSTSTPADNANIGMPPQEQEPTPPAVPVVEPMTPPSPQETPTIQNEPPVEKPDEQNPMSSVMDNLQSKATADVTKPTW